MFKISTYLHFRSQYLEPTVRRYTVLGRAPTSAASEDKDYHRYRQEKVVASSVAVFAFVRLTPSDLYPERAVDNPYGRKVLWEAEK